MRPMRTPAVGTTPFLRLTVAFLLVAAAALAGCTAAPDRPTVAAGTTVSPGTETGTESKGDGGESEGEGEGGATGAKAELLEQSEITQERLDAYQAAAADGSLRVEADPPHATAPGWTGEVVMDPTADDWEPAIAADRRAPFVYALTTRYTRPKACATDCPSPFIALYVSRNGGAHWSPSRPLCRCRGIHGQYDPIIEVVPKTGAVYAAWMNNFNVVFSKSTDHGRTWTAPIPTFGDVPWQDKPILATSPNGRSIYIAWNGPSGGDPWVAISHDAGATWSQKRVLSTDRYYYAFGGQVLPGGTIVFAEASLSYTGPHGGPAGTVRYHALRSTDRGRTWQNVVLDARRIGERCVADGCSTSYYAGHAVVSTDAQGNLVFLHDGAAQDRGPQSVWVQRSSNRGASWSAPVRLSTAGNNATFPAVVGRGHGDVRAFYMQEDNGPDVWNVWYRSSKDAGKTWSQPVRISDATGGAAYIGPDGFMEPYGDYGEVAITNTGRFVAIWGEGNSYTGPGGVWFNRRS